MELIIVAESDTVEFQAHTSASYDVKKAAELVTAVKSRVRIRGDGEYFRRRNRPDAEILASKAHMPHDSKKAASFEATFYRCPTLAEQKMNRIPAIDTRSS